MELPDTDPTLVNTSEEQPLPLPLRESEEDPGPGTEAPVEKDPAAELMDQLYAALTDPDRGPSAWRLFLAGLVKNCDAVSAAVGTLVPDGERTTLIANLLVPILRNGFRDSTSALELFRIAESMGAHILPVHFYSPVPNTAGIPENCWEERFDQAPGWSLNYQNQVRLLETLASYSEDFAAMRAVPVDIADHPAGWSECDLAFNPTDAALYYSMIRHFRPRKVLEIGSGHSTHIAATACLQVEPEPSVLESIEPYPASWLNGMRGLSNLSVVPVQDVELSRFQELGLNDILFIDCSHICKIGSDVNYLFFHVLPALQPGVIVHIHDIFLPWNFPRKWVIEEHCFWNEQYLLLAFLQGNADFEVLLASHYLGKVHGEKVTAAFPAIQVPGGVSFWIRRKG